MDTASALVPAFLHVRRVHRETPDTLTLHLDGSNRPGGFAFRPGQFTMLYAFGIGEIPVSISGDPGCPQELVHTIRNVGPVTAALCGVRKGGVLGARGPFGRAWPLEEARGGDLLVIAGGLGFAPLRPVIYEALSRREDYRRISILVGARTPESVLYRAELRRWARRDDLQVRVTVDRAPSDWTGHVGVVPALLSEVEIDPDRTTALLCGPEVMMQFTLRELARLGVADARVHLSLERNMKCAVGFCGHCQYGPDFVCKDGPVFRFDEVRSRFWIKEV